MLSNSGSSNAAKTSPTTEVVAFVGGDKNIVCNGNNVKWLYPNSTEIVESSSKYQITSTEDESILTVKEIDMMSIGAYKCIAFVNGSYTEKYFNLKIYCELNLILNCSFFNFLKILCIQDPLTINHISRIIFAKENDPVSLKCKTISVPQAEKVTWYFEGEELSNNIFLLLNPTRTHN
jgi:hypothetical protein